MCSTLDLGCSRRLCSAVSGGFLSRCMGDLVVSLAGIEDQQHTSFGFSNTLSFTRKVEMVDD